MKSPTLLVILILLIFFSACQEKEEPFSPNLIGNWEIANVDESIGLEGVINYIFSADGTYTFQIFFREPGEANILGYQLIWKGNFRSSGDQLKLMPQETFYPPVGVNRPPFVNKEEMVNQNFTPGSVNNERFRISEDGQELLIYAIDPQAENQLYSKVE
jgi:hypothetical protein